MDRLSFEHTTNIQNKRGGRHEQEDIGEHGTTICYYRECCATTLLDGVLFGHMLLVEDIVLAEDCGIHSVHNPALIPDEKEYRSYLYNACKSV